MVAPMESIKEPFALTDGLTARYKEDANWRYVDFYGYVPDGTERGRIPVEFTITTYYLKRQPLLREALERLLAEDTSPPPIKWNNA